MSNHKLFITKVQEMADSLFDEWLEREKSSRREDDLRDAFWWDYDEASLSEEYQEISAVGDSNITFDSFFEEKFREKAKEWFDNRINEIIYDFTYNLDIEGDKFKIYRKISVITKDIPLFIESLKNKTKFGVYSGVGSYFAYKEECAEAHWGKFDKNYSQVMVVALADFDFVCLSESILKNLDTTLGEAEAEIQLEGKEVFIERVDDIEVQSMCLIE